MSDNKQQSSSNEINRLSEEESPEEEETREEEEDDEKDDEEEEEEMVSTPTSVVHSDIGPLKLWHGLPLEGSSDSSYVVLKNWPSNDDITKALKAKESNKQVLTLWGIPERLAVNTHASSQLMVCSLNTYTHFLFLVFSSIYSPT